MPKPLTETTPLSEAGSATPKNGRMKVHAISAGLGSSGYYSPKVIEQAAADQLIATGTPLYFDHPSESEAHDRPERSVRDIAAVFTEPALYDAEAQALVGEVQIFGPYRDLVSEMAPYIGLSIHGSATDVVEGEHDGRRVPVIEGLAAIDSVDLVTRAGRGGMFLLESVRPAKTNRRAVSHGIAEATVNDTREALQTALRDAHGDDDVWVWVRDFDDATVWFDIESGDDAGTYGQAYTNADGVVSLTGDRAEVRVATTYVPVTRPDSTNTTTEADQEVTMGKIQIEESEHRSLIEKAGRVDALEEAAARRDREDRATAIINDRATEAGVEFTALESRGLRAGLPLTDDGQLDETAFTNTVDEAAADKKASESGATDNGGRVHGFGASAPDTGDITEAATPTTTAWGRPITGATKGA